MKTLKAKVILGKKQIVLAALVLVLGAAVYLNWQFASDSNKLALSDVMAQNPENPMDLVVDNDASFENDELFPSVDIQNDSGIKLINQIESTDNSAEKVNADAAAADIDAAAADGADITAAGESGEKVKNLGDTLLVNAEAEQQITGKSIVDGTYFTIARLARDKSRDEAVETMAMILNDDKLSDGDKQAVSDKAMSLTDIIETETRTENLIKAKGFEECMVYITDASANVVVKTDGLDQDSATQIKNIIVSEGKIAGENIYITEIN